MTSPAKLNELTAAEEPARELLERLGYTYVPREELAEEREGEREVPLTGQLTAALLRLNEWMTKDDADRVIFNLQHVDASALARNREVHTYLAYGMPLTVNRGGRQETPTVRIFDFDRPGPGVGLNECVVTTQFRVRRSIERGGARTSEDDEKVIKPDLVLFVNGIPLVVMETKSPTIGDDWKSQVAALARDATSHSQFDPSRRSYLVMAASAAAVLPLAGALGTKAASAQTAAAPAAGDVPACDTQVAYALVVVPT